MQHHPGSWYLPWGVPLQKMVAVPIHPAAGLQQLHHPALVQPAMLAGLPAPLTPLRTFVTQPAMRQPTQRKVPLQIINNPFLIPLPRAPFSLILQVVKKYRIMCENARKVF